MQSQNIFSSILSKFSHSSEAETFIDSLNYQIHKLENKVIELQKETVTLREQLNKEKPQKKQKKQKKQGRKNVQTDSTSIRNALKNYRDNVDRGLIKDKDLQTLSVHSLQILGALIKHGPMPLSQLRTETNYTSGLRSQQYRAALGDLDEQGKIRFSTMHEAGKTGRPVTYVSLN
tara:strand:+ start:1295 stop:1819 length:525 start_codon:yes stop_codon:yes gene_type:complete